MADEHGRSTTGPPVEVPARGAGEDRQPFVGRDDELVVLEARWRVACEGRPQLVALAGEPGVGKTRLATTFARRVLDDGATVLVGRCDEDPIERYQPFAEALRGLLGGSEPVLLPSDAWQLARIVPDLADRLPAPEGEPVEDVETQRYRLFQAVAEVLAAATTSRPVLLLVDDLQWADQPTLLLLRHLVRQPPPLRLMVLGTIRDTEVARGHPLGELLADLHREEGLLRRIEVRGLDPDAIVEMMTRLAGEDLGAEGREMAEALWRATGGNPLFIRETVAHLAALGAVYRDDDGRWQTRQPIAEMPIPDGVRDVIHERVRRLGPDVERTLAHAAVIGHRFDVRLLARIVALAAPTVVDHLAAALRSQLVLESADVVDEYAFVHALVRETLYGGVTRSRRLRLHRLVGEALEADAGSASAPKYAAMARHFAAAPDSESRAKALEYAVRAAGQAMDALAYEAAINHYRRAIAVLDEAGDPGGDRRAALLVLLGQAQQLAGRVDHSRQSFRRASELAGPDGAAIQADAALGFAGVWGEPGNPDPETVRLLEAALARLPVEEAARRARLLSRLSNELFFSVAGHRRAIELGHEAVAVAERSGDLAAITEARWQSRSMMGMPVARAERAALGADLLARNVRQGVGGGIMAAHGWALLDHLEAGDVDAARADIDAYDALLRRLRLPFRRWYPTLWRATLAMQAGRLEEADALNAEAVAIAGDDADAMLFTNWAAQVFALRHLQGRSGELIGSLDAVIDQRPGIIGWRAALALVLHSRGDDAPARVLYEGLVGPGIATLPYDVLWLLTCTLLAELAVGFGDQRRGAELAAALDPFADAEVVTGYGAFCFGPVSLRLAMLARLAGAHSDAATWLDRADAHTAAMGAPLWAAAARLERAALLDAAGADPAAARALRTGVVEEAEANGWGLLVARTRSASPQHRATPVSPW